MRRRFFHTLRVVAAAVKTCSINMSGQPAHLGASPRAYPVALLFAHELRALLEQRELGRVALVLLRELGNAGCACTSL
jgi:hypothetical protein